MGRFTYLVTSDRVPEPQESDIEVTVTTPDAVAKGEVVNIEVTLRTLHGTLKDREVGAVHGYVGVVVSGPVSLELKADGLRNNNYVFAGKNVLLTGGHAEFIAEEPGEYTFRPGDIWVTTEDYPLSCTPKGEFAIESKTQVS
jgi:hypothetical protein